MGCQSSKSKIKFNPTTHNYEYDIIVIGGGSGGLACARESAKLGARVALCDYVVPSPKGSQWGLGGTCVNVGCIPKRLMHQSNLIKDYVGDAPIFGWTGIPENPGFKWETLVERVQDYISSLNFGYRIFLNKDKIKYFNGLGKFQDEHTIKISNPENGQTSSITGQCIVIAVGGRPRYLSIPGGTAKDNLCITSDDIFSLEKPPGKTLCVGAGYISVECAGFLAGFGYEVSLMARSVILRNFDQGVVNILTSNLTSRNVNIIQGVEPTEIKKAGNKLKVKWPGGEEDFDTVLLAVGRDPCTSYLNLEAVPGIKKDGKGEIITDEGECTGVPHIFAIGDCVLNRPKLTPAAIVAGKWLARRIFSRLANTTFDKLVKYDCIPTVIFTPIEYGTCGMSEEDATDKFGYDNIEIYHKAQLPLEFSLNKRDSEAMYAKLICRKAKTQDQEQVVGFHYLGPNAGDITVGFSMAVKRKCRKREFNDLVGIHPTCAEIFCEMTTSKNDKVLPAQEKGC